MNNFDFIILDLFLKENSDFFENSRLQKIQQPTRKELIFSMRRQGETRKFYININPKFFHCCFMSKENEKKRLLEIPKSPPMFCMLLRKYLEGAKIAKVLQPENERILEFYFETYNELSEKIYLCLAIELMGKHSNVVLYNYDTNIIIGCAHNVGAEKSSIREIIGGLPYTYPPKKTNRIISGISSLYKENYSINDFIDDYFASHQEQDKIKNLKAKLLANAQSKLKKTMKALEKVKKQSKSEEKILNYRKKGDLISANLFNNKDFTSAMEVFDWESNSAVKIELDKTKTLKENAANYYKLYKKAKTAHLKTREMIEKLDQEKNYLEQLLYSVESAQTIEDLIEIKNETGSDKQEKSKNKSFSALHLTLSPLRINDFSVYVGKNNKQNNYIVSKLSRDKDLWFHARNCAGSHVLLRVEAGQKTNDEIIFKCAKLAKEHSVGKNSTKVGVIYTYAKNLKKPPASPLGYVTYKDEKEIIVD